MKESLMKEARIVALHDPQPEESVEDSLRDQINEVLEEHQEDLKAKVRKWMKYHADFGVRTLNLDNFDLILSEPDRKYIVGWLKEEDFTVHASRFGRRVIIDLPSKK